MKLTQEEEKALGIVKNYFETIVKWKEDAEKWRKVGSHYFEIYEDSVRPVKYVLGDMIEGMKIVERLKKRFEETLPHNADLGEYSIHRELQEILEGKE